jgi:hydrogenase maturation protease
MSTKEKHAPVLIFTYGNPSRGDDAVGPTMFELLEKHKWGTSGLDNVDLLTDYQLQIEHAVDLEYREGVVFVDASASSSAPYEFIKLHPERDDSYTSHAMSPASVLDVYQHVNKSEPPPSYALAIRGYGFELGQDMTEQAKKNLNRAFEFITDLIEIDVENWPEKARNVRYTN